MIAYIDKARYLGDYKIWLRFDDGAEGEVDLSQDLDGPVFEPLRRVEFFRSFQLHPELTFGLTAPTSRRSFCTRSCSRNRASPVDTEISMKSAF